MLNILGYFRYYFIYSFFGQPVPSRDEIPYTTAFDHSISVDKWGNLHIGVAVGYAPGAYSITTGVDSLINIYDIYTINGGASWQGVFLGHLKTFRGTWGNYTSDNRTYVSRNKAGDKMFFTWNDTHMDGEVNNQDPDVFARGFDLIQHKLTSPDAGMDASTVTFLCDITQEAYGQCTSPIVFTDNSRFTLPICTQWFSDATADSRFKYIPDFSYIQSDFTVPTTLMGFDEKTGELPGVAVFPNPVKDLATVSMDLKLPANVSFEVTNLIGRPVLIQYKGNMEAGNHRFSIDAGHFSPGVYFITVRAHELKVTKTVIVE